MCVCVYICKIIFQANELIYDYITAEMLPVSTVEKISFKDLVSDLSHGLLPLCRRTTMNYFEDRKKQMLDRLI